MSSNMQHENLTTQLEFLSPSCRFKFPSVFIIYQTITVTVYAILILIGYTAKEALFCSSDDVRESLEKPTPFCILIGRTLHYHIHVSVRVVLSPQALFSFWCCQTKPCFHFGYQLKTLEPLTQ